MRRIALFSIVCLISTGLLAQATSSAQADLAAAEAAVRAAESAGAPIYAKELYDQAQSRLTAARTNLNSSRSSERDAAQMRALEALRAAQAAEAAARLHSITTEARNLTADISRFGGTPPALQVGDLATSNIAGGTSKERVARAEQAVDRARAVGGDAVAGDLLKDADSKLSTARQILKGTRNSDSADYLAFMAEMLARRAEALALAAPPERVLPGLRLERTRLAKAAVEAEAEAERARRMQMERETLELRAKLASEQAAHDAQAQEAARLREQLEQDRQARLQASARLEELRANYESALNRAGSVSEVENLRRQVEDQQFALNTIREREIRSDESMRAEISRLQQELQAERQRGETGVAERESQLQQSQARLDELRIEREAAESKRLEAERRHQQAILEAQNRLEAVQAESAEVKQQLANAQAELDKARAELAARQAADAMQAQLNAIAPTRRDDRGFIVTLPGLLFDTGKSTLKQGAMNTLDRLAEQIKTRENAKIVVEGHTDSVGSDESNMKLSEQRANSVREHLASRGIPGDRITSVGRGEAAPVATNDTPAGRQQNRRVELLITE
jgi:outer membrane protein OmpA-like peptidoglycan-associated protein